LDVGPIDDIFTEISLLFGDIESIKASRTDLRIARRAGADESFPLYVAAYLGFGEVLQLEDFVTGQSRNSAPDRLIPSV